MIYSALLGVEMLRKGCPMATTAPEICLCTMGYVDVKIAERSLFSWKDGVADVQVTEILQFLSVWCLYFKEE